MSEKLKIGVVVVTFNNAEMLRSVIDALLCQTRMPDEIVVIDNASLDNTQDIVKEFQDVRYIRLAENTGSAGGFHEGIRIAVENNDFVMTLDDDIGLESNAIEIMERYLKTLSKEYNVGALRCWFKESKRVEGIRRINSFAWRGTLLNRDAIRDVGLPIKKYFLYAEDAEYGYRIYKNGWDMFIIPEYLITEKRKTDKLRFKFFGEKVFYKEKFRYYYAFRNQVNMYWKYREWNKLFETVSYGIKVVVLLIIMKHIRSMGYIKAIINGFFDGLISRLGKNPKYLPETKK